MTRNINSVLRLAIIVRGSTPTLYQGLSLKLLRSSADPKRRFVRTFSLKMTEISQLEEQKGLSSSEDSLSMAQKLRKCRTPGEVLYLVDEEIHQMDGYTSAECLLSLVHMQKKQSGQGDEQISQSNEFTILYENLKKRIEELSPDDAVQVINCLLHFKVPANSVLIQKLLEIIRNDMDQLSINQICFLNVLLKKLPKNPLVATLNTALPSAFKGHVKMKLHDENLQSLVNSLQYLKYMNISNEIMSKIWKIFEKIPVNNFSPSQAKHILFCLLNWTPDEQVKKLITKMQDILVENMDKFDEKELHAILLKFKEMNDHKKRQDNIYYHKNFIDAIAITVVFRDLGLRSAINVLDFLSEMEHVNVIILDYIAALYLKDEEILKNANKYDISKVISALAHANYKTPFWGKLKNSLMSPKLLENNAGRLAKIALHLVILDCYMPNLFGIVFKTCKVHDANDTRCRGLLLLYYSVKNKYPEFKGPWPFDAVLKRSANFSLPKSQGYILQSAVETAVGGSEYVITSMKTKLGDDIDHVVIMRKGGYPIAINNTEKHVPRNVEDLNPPSDSQVLLFMCPPAYAYARNTEQLTGYWSLVIEQTEAITKYPVIPIYRTKWNSMSESEQIQYILQIIKLKCQELSEIER